MSWDKRTINMSHLDMVRELLDDSGFPYTLIVQESVPGFGINDDIPLTGEPKYYDLRRLQYGNWVILERIERTADCDEDDTISSHKFSLWEEPKDWKYIIEGEDSYER